MGRPRRMEPSHTTVIGQIRRLHLDRTQLIAPWRGWSGLAALAGGAYVLAYLGLFVARPAGDWGAQLLSDFGEVPVQLIEVGLALAIVARQPYRRARGAWALFAVALACDLAGNLIYAVYDQMGQLPTTSIADAFFLGFYPFLVLGLLALPTASPKREILTWRVWPNVAIVLLGGTMALVHFAVVPAMAQLSGDPLALIVTLAYPFGDFSLIAALAAISTRRPYARDRAALGWFIVAITAWFFGDMAVAVASSTSLTGPGGISDVIWVCGDFAFVLAARAAIMTLGMPERENAGEDLRIGILGPYAMLGLGLATLVAATAFADPEIAFLAVLTAGLTVIVVARQVMEENRRRKAEAALVADHAEAAERAQSQARHDALTGLPNRMRLHELLNAEIERSRLTGRPVTLAFIDLNCFKTINDNLGHAMGDEVLVEVAGRLARSVRESDVVTRPGGDEFAVVLPATSAEGALEVAVRARAELERPVVVGGTEIAVGGAFGLATYPDCGAEDGDGLMRRADAAMYRAKRNHVGPTAYEASFDRQGPDASALAQLRAAIDLDGLTLLFQPIRERAGGTTAAVEALVRWKHPSRGLLAPHEFLPLAIQMGLIGALDARVLDLACLQSRAWREAGLDVCVSVNSSRDSLQDPRYLALLASTLEKHALPASSILLEVTEDGIFENAERARDFVELAAQRGVRMAIDDFGTGFSSLGRLRDLPVDYLKIDRSFVTGVLFDRQSTAIIEAVVNLAHRLGKEVVAEGVEDEATLAYLDQIGVDHTQGFYIGRPVSPDQITARLHEEAARARQRAHISAFKPSPRRAS